MKIIAAAYNAMNVIVAAIYFIKHLYLHLESTHFYISNDMIYIKNILYDKGGIKIPDSIEYQFTI